MALLINDPLPWHAKLPWHACSSSVARQHAVAQRLRIAGLCRVVVHSIQTPCLVSPLRYSEQMIPTRPLNRYGRSQDGCRKCTKVYNCGRECEQIRTFWRDRAGFRVIGMTGPNWWPASEGRPCWGDSGLPTAGTMQVSLHAEM